MLQYNFFFFFGITSPTSVELSDILSDGWHLCRRMYNKPTDISEIRLFDMDRCTLHWASKRTISLL